MQTKTSDGFEDESSTLDSFVFEAQQFNDEEEVTLARERGPTKGWVEVNSQ